MDQVLGGVEKVCGSGRVCEQCGSGKGARECERPGSGRVCRVRQCGMSTEEGRKR